MALSSRKAAETTVAAEVIELCHEDLEVVSGGDKVAVAAVHGKDCSAKVTTDSTGASYVVITCK